MLATICSLVWQYMEVYALLQQWLSIHQSQRCTYQFPSMLRSNQAIVGESVQHFCSYMLDNTEESFAVKRSQLT